MKKLASILVWSLVLTWMPLAAFAQDAASGASESGLDAAGLAVGAGLAIGLAALGCGIGQGLTAGNTTSGIARNPGAAGAMFTNFVLAMVLIESIAIYGLVVALLLIFRIPGG